MNPKILSDRLQKLGWTPYRLAQELGKVRQEDKGANNYASTVKKALNNPENSKAKTLEDLVSAMGGQLIIRWENKKEIVTGYQEVKIIE